MAAGRAKRAVRCTRARSFDQIDAPSPYCVSFASPESVKLPKFLREKADTKAADLPNTTVRGYLIKWLTDWVREYGVDGFRCDTVKHVEPEAWAALKAEAVKALAEFNQPGTSATDTAAGRHQRNTLHCSRAVLE